MPHADNRNTKCGKCGQPPRSHVIERFRTFMWPGDFPVSHSFRMPS